MAGGGLTRRRLAALAMGAPLTVAIPRRARAAGPLKVGVMLPLSGTYAQLGENIITGFELYLAERGGKLGGREVTLIKLDDQSDPATAAQNVNRLLKRDGADILVGTVHSGVVMALVDAAREKGVPLIIPNAGNGVATGALCAPNIFRSSFTNWQPVFGMGRAAAAAGVKRAAFITWDYSAGKESAAGFAQGLQTGGAELVKVLTLPFPAQDFQPLLAQLPGLNVDTCGAFFAGSGAVQFVKDYAAAGLKDSIPLCGSGFLTEGVLSGQGEAADGVRTALHYGDGIDTPRNTSFRAAFLARAGREADVYAVQGYDAGQLLAAGLDAVGGDLEKDLPMYAAMQGARIDSPRGAFTLSAAHNPVQDIYLREVRAGKNVVIGVAAAALADPASGCKMATG